MSRRPPSLLFCLAVAVVPSTAHADDTGACIDASARGQEQRDKGKLRDARESFLACSRTACHAIIRTDCAAWLADVEARTPSIVVSAQDPDGRDVADVRVSLDGQPLADHLEARAIPLDPGEHTFRFERAGSLPVTRAVILREGERRRVISVRFSPEAKAEKRRSIPAAPIALAGVGLLGGGVFAGLAWSAKSDVDRMRASCAPGCKPAEVEAARAKLIAANVSLGVGIAALGAAGIVLIVRSRAPSSPVALTLHPVLGGGAAMLRGTF